MPLDPSKSPFLQPDKNTYSKSSLSTWLYFFVYLPGSHLTGPSVWTLSLFQVVGLTRVHGHDYRVPFPKSDLVFQPQAKSAGWWLSPTPLKNMSSSVGMMTFPTYGKNWENKQCSEPLTSHTIIWSSGGYNPKWTSNTNWRNIQATNK